MTISEVFSMIINTDVSAQPIGFRDAIRIQMKRTPVLSLILILFISGLIAVGSLWDSEAVGQSHADIAVNERKRQVCLGANWAHVGKLRMRKSAPKCSSSCSWGSMWPQVNLSPQ